MVVRFQTVNNWEAGIWDIMVAASYGVWDQLALTLLGSYGTFLPLESPNVTLLVSPAPAVIPAVMVIPLQKAIQGAKLLVPGQCFFDIDIPGVL